MMMAYLQRVGFRAKSATAVLGLVLPLVVAACSSDTDSGLGAAKGGAGGSTGGTGGSTGGSGGSTGGSGGNTAGSGGSTGGSAGSGGGGTGGNTGGTSGAAGSGGTSGSGGSAGKADGGATGGTAGTAGTAGTGGTAGAAGSGGAAGGAPDGGGTGGTAGAGGGAADGGGADGGGVVVVPPGDPIVVPDMTWKAVPTAGAICRDKTATGFAVNLNMASDKLIIYMAGGGACFNAFTCGANPRTWAATDPNAAMAGSTFVINRAAANNPFKDWNMAYIPYCTGDVHTGTNMTGFNGDAHMGYSNYLKYLGKLVATFKGKPLTQIVLSGSSAGGFGVAWNWMTTQDAFGVPVTALDDSGPPYGPSWLSACHQQRTATLWGWAGSVHPTCTACDLTAGNVVIPLLEASMKRQTTRFGFTSYDEDGVIKTFLAYGLNNCANWDSLLPPPFPAGQYPMALADLRSRWMGNPLAAMYVVSGTSHTVLGSDLSAFKTGTNITMLEWVTKLVNNDTGWTNINP